MFNIHNLRAMLALPDLPEGAEIDQLRNRVAALEEENASLRRLDETIRKNARLFAALLDKCQEGIGLISPDLIVLRLIHSSVGYSEMEVSGQPLIHFIHPDDVNGFQNSFSQVLSAHAKSISCEFRLKKKDGTWAWLAGQLTDMLDDPDVQAILLNVRNITEQKERVAVELGKAGSPRS
jgi:PAS domain S-box-containing protein